MTPILSQLKHAASPITEPVQKAGKWIWTQTNEDTRVGLKSVVCALTSSTCTVASAYLLENGAIPAIQVATAIGVSVVATRIFTHPSPTSIAMTLGGAVVVLCPEGFLHCAGLIGSSFLGAVMMSKVLGIEVSYFLEDLDDHLELPPMPVVQPLPLEEPLPSYLLAAEGA